MSSSQLIDETAKRLGLPRDVVAKVVIDWGRNIHSQVSNETNPIIYLHGFGYFYFKSWKSYKYLEVKIKRLESARRRYDPYLKMGSMKHRRIITVLIDNCNAHFSQIIQNHVSNGQFRKSFTKRNKYDFDILDAIFQRFYTVVDSLPCQLHRQEPSQVQKATLLKLFRSKMYINLPDEVDCPLWPLRMYNIRKNRMYGLSLSSIILERDKWVEACRVQATQDYLKSQAHASIQKQ